VWGLLWLFGSRESRVESEWKERSIFSKWQKYPCLKKYKLFYKKKGIWSISMKKEISVGVGAIVCHEEKNVGGKL
jgi:hypothetical protein